jgi:hypothetical protein
MMMPHYETVFEIGLRSFPWAEMFHPAIAVAIGVPLFLFAKGKTIYQAVGIVVAIFGAFLFLIVAITLVSEYVPLRHAYASGDSSIAEGVVENFHPAPVLGPAIESFSVRGVVFTYNALDSTPCFHDAPYRKGPIRPGLEVRIFYRDGCIQRVDVRQ